MKIIETSIDGLVIVEPAIYGDERGYFFEAYNQANYVAAGIRADFVQDNLSFSLRGVLRGLHGQNPNSQGKLVSCLQGEIFDVAVDLREGSPTFGKWESVILSPKIGRQFFIPRCFAHGFLVLSESALFSYKVDSYYDPKSEYSIRSREVLMCSELYEDDIPLRLPNTQLPPTRSDFSKQSTEMPRSWRLLTAAIPEEPAPITQAVGSSVIAPA